MLFFEKAVLRIKNTLQRIAHDHTHSFWLFESSIGLHMLANSFLAIFIPILMFQAGFTLTEILLFYVIFHLINIPANFFGQYLTEAIGAKRTIVIATLFQVLFFVTYSTLEGAHWETLFSLALFAALYDGLYYVASLFVFMKTSADETHTGENTGLLYGTIRLAKLLGPSIGAVVLLVTGHITFVLVAIVITLVLSLIPLWKINLSGRLEHKKNSIKSFFTDKQEILNHLSLGLAKIDEAVGIVLWPLFLFLFFGELSSIAALAVLVPLTALVFSFATGFLARKHRHRAIAMGALAIACIWVGRIFVESGTWYYSSVIIAGFFSLFIMVPLDTELFRRGAAIDPLVSSTLKNTVSMFFKFLLYSSLLIISLIFGEHLVFTSAFIIATGALLLLSAINLHFKKFKDFS